MKGFFIFRASCRAASSRAILRDIFGKRVCKNNSFTTGACDQIFVNYFCDFINHGNVRGRSSTAGIDDKVDDQMIVNKPGWKGFCQDFCDGELPNSGHSIYMNDHFLANLVNFPIVAASPL